MKRVATAVPLFDFFLEQLTKQFLQALTQGPVERNLWIVEAGRIRIHQADAGA